MRLDSSGRAKGESILNQYTLPYCSRGLGQGLPLIYSPKPGNQAIKSRPSDRVSCAKRADSRCGPSTSDLTLWRCPGVGLPGGGVGGGAGSSGPLRPMRVAPVCPSEGRRLDQSDAGLRRGVDAEVSVFSGHL